MSNKFKIILKQRFYPLIKLIVSTKIIWKSITYLIRLTTWLKYEKSKLDQSNADKNLEVFFKDKVVRSGFFKGLKYFSFSAVGSSIFPKLLGSYEMELLPTLNSFSSNSYKTIVDIGCAEGFYAVGMALRFTEAKIYAFDIDKKALELCAHLADFNEVASQVILSSVCDSVTLNQLNLSDRNLIICDCEGYEKELFTQENFNNFLHSDLIIELHPFYSIGVKQYLISLFQLSHNCSIVSSLDNTRKLSEWKNNLPDLNKLEQLKAIEEGRPCTMDWLIAESIIYK